MGEPNLRNIGPNFFPAKFDKEHQGPEEQQDRKKSPNMMHPTYYRSVDVDENVTQGQHNIAKKGSWRLVR